MYVPAFVCFCLSNRKNKGIFGYLRKWGGLTNNFFSKHFVFLKYYIYVCIYIYIYTHIYIYIYLLFRAAPEACGGS